MNTFKKYWQRSKNKVCAVLCMIALISINCVPLASAASISSTWTLGIYSKKVTGGFSQRLAYSLSSPAENYVSNGISDVDYSHDTVGFNSSYKFTSPFKIYFSYYLKYDKGSFSPMSLVYDRSGYEIRYLNRFDQVGYLDNLTVDQFTPNEVMLHTSGVSFVISGHASEVEYLDNLKFIPKLDSSFARTGGNGFQVVIPSFVVITSESSAELDALDSLASEIANQSQILEAMKGDIVGLLQQIYTSTGDIEIAFDLLNGYIEQLLPLINSINNNTSNIYSLLSTQFELLRAAISTESQNIQDAIEKQTEDLKTYFDDVLGGAVGTLPDDNASADDIINESHDDEQQYHSDALNRFNELSASFNGFNGDVGSGIALVGTLFSRVWGALGNYVIVYTFPLLLGLALVIIGRLGRGMVKKSSQDRNPDE